MAKRAQARRLDGSRALPRAQRQILYGLSHFGHRVRRDLYETAVSLTARGLFATAGPLLRSLSRLSGEALPAEALGLALDVAHQLRSRPRSGERPRLDVAIVEDVCTFLTRLVIHEERARRNRGARSRTRGQTRTNEAQKNAEDDGDAPANAAGTSKSPARSSQATAQPPLPAQARGDARALLLSLCCAVVGEYITSRSWKEAVQFTQRFSDAGGALVRGLEGVVLYLQWHEGVFDGALDPCAAAALAPLSEVEVAALDKQFAASATKHKLWVSLPFQVTSRLREAGLASTVVHALSREVSSRFPYAGIRAQEQRADANVGTRADSFLLPAADRLRVVDDGCQQSLLFVRCAAAVRFVRGDAEGAAGVVLAASEETKHGPQGALWLTLALLFAAHGDRARVPDLIQAATRLCISDPSSVVPAVTAMVVAGWVEGSRSASTSRLAVAAAALAAAAADARAGVHGQRHAAGIDTAIWLTLCDCIHLAGSQEDQRAVAATIHAARDASHDIATPPGVAFARSEALDAIDEIIGSAAPPVPVTLRSATEKSSSVLDGSLSDRRMQDVSVDECASTKGSESPRDLARRTGRGSGLGSGNAGSAGSSSTGKEKSSSSISSTRGNRDNESSVSNTIESLAGNESVRDRRSRRATHDGAQVANSTSGDSDRRSRAVANTLSRRTGSARKKNTPQNDSQGIAESSAKAENSEGVRNVAERARESEGDRGSGSSGSGSGSGSSGSGSGSGSSSSSGSGSSGSGSGSRSGSSSSSGSGSSSGGSGSGNSSSGSGSGGSSSGSGSGSNSSGSGGSSGSGSGSSSSGSGSGSNSSGSGGSSGSGSGSGSGSSNSSTSSSGSSSDSDGDSGSGSSRSSSSSDSSRSGSSGADEARRSHRSRPKRKESDSISLHRSSIKTKNIGSSRSSKQKKVELGATSSHAADEATAGKAGGQAQSDVGAAGHGQPLRDLHMRTLRSGKNLLLEQLSNDSNVPAARTENARRGATGTGVATSAGRRSQELRPGTRASKRRSNRPDTRSQASGSPKRRRTATRNRGNA